MSIDIVRGELERLFTLDEMTQLSADLLGLDPKAIGGTASKASFARALADHCMEIDAVHALLDSMILLRGNEVDPRARELLSKGFVRPEELKAGDAFGPFKITKKVAEGPRAIVYGATKDGADRTLKVFRHAVAAQGGTARRFLVHARKLAKISHENLAADVEAGLVNGKPYVAYASIDAQPLSARIARTGPLHLNEARNFLKGILAGLGALHEQKVAHGALKLENVLIGRGEGGVQKAILVDAGLDMLSGDLATSPFFAASLAKARSPEQIRGKLADMGSDFFGFGTLLFEILSGKAPFSGDNALELSIAHLNQEAAAPGTIGPRGWVSKEMDELCAKLLKKNAAERLKDLSAVLLVIDPMAAVAVESAKEEQKKTFSDDKLDDHIALLMTDPSDPDFALTLEGTIAQGADPQKVAEAFSMAAEEVQEGEDDESKQAAKETKKQLLFRTGRIFETVIKDLEAAEGVYAQILELDPEDDIAFAALEKVRRELDKHDELVEMLLERSESSKSATERARVLNAIGHLHDEKDQAVFAFAQALAQDTQHDEYATDLERTAGNDMKLWAEALQILSQATTDPTMPPEAKIALFTRLGRWYAEKIARPDLGLPCFQAVLSVDPSNDGAMAGLSHLYRRAQQWEELSQVLQTRADRAPTPEQARDLRAEAAELFEKNLNDSGRARDLYEQIFEQDPGHAKASEALDRIYHRLEDHKGLAKILERRVEALRGEAKVETICKLAELHENELNAPAEATRRYEAALELDPQNLTALKGLDRIYNRSGRYKELTGNLERQIAISATPRQKINLYERLAGIYDEEFLDHAKAAEALEAVLHIDSAHEGALTNLIRHYRVLDRWEDVVSLYEKHLRIVSDEKRRVELLLAMGRVLVEQIGSPERARKVYERVLEIDPHHAGALESLANVRAATGDALAALSAIESLASKATTPENKADLWLRAAKMLEQHGDKDGAIERYKAALDAQPTNTAAMTALRAAYLARGDATSAVELLLKTIDVTDGNLSKARLYGEMAHLLRDKLKETERAQQAASKAVDLDPTNMAGLVILGDYSFEAGRFIEASKYYESLANRVDVLSVEEGTQLLIHYVDALSKSGSAERAIGTVQTLLSLAPDNPDAISRAAKVNFDAKKPKEAAVLYASLLKRFGESLSADDKFEASLKLGEARLLSGDTDGALEPLSEAADLKPESPLPVAALCKVYEAKKDWEEVIRQKTRRLDVITGDDRIALLMEIGEIVAKELNDRTRAAKTFVAALDERPDDRKILTKLMQLYSEEKDWGKLVEVVMKLASKVEDRKQKAKYLHTAAIVSWRQLGEIDKALEFYEQVLELDPSLDKPLSEAIELRVEKNDHEGVERLLQMELERATDANDTAKMLATFEKLAALYKDKLNWTEDAIDAYEAAQTLDPDNAEREEKLAALYASDPANYFDKAIASHMVMLRRNPYKPDIYKLFRKLYTDAKRADAAWCICQALFCMNIAEPDEERFFRRMRADSAAVAQDRLNEEDWIQHLTHTDCDPLLTAIFSVIQPAVLKRNGQPLEALGYQLAYKLDLSMHPYPMSQTLNYAAGVLGMEPPMTFQNPNDPGGVQFLHAYTPSIVLGAAALMPDIPTQAAAFIAARHLTYYRPGLYLRHLVPTGTGLRAWLFAAIKMISPNFPIAPELDLQVKDNLAALEPTIVGPAREQLISAVTKLLQAGAIDLKKWVIGVDLTADRAGFLLANDLELAQEMIKAADEGAAALPQKERIKELVLFSVSESHFAIRRRLGVNIDA